jgi:hypothetical protein
MQAHRLPSGYENYPNQIEHYEQVTICGTSLSHTCHSLCWIFSVECVFQIENFQALPHFNAEQGGVRDSGDFFRR